MSLFWCLTLNPESPLIVPGPGQEHGPLFYENAPSLKQVSAPG